MQQSTTSSNTCEPGSGARVSGYGVRLLSSVFPALLSRYGLPTVVAVFTLVGCASVERPNTMAWGVNGAKAQLEGYNIKEDYDDNGVRKPDAVLKTKPLPFGLKSLNGAICFLPPSPGDQGISGLKKWIGDARDWSREHCN